MTKFSGGVKDYSMFLCPSVKKLNLIHWTNILSCTNNTNPPLIIQAHRGCSLLFSNWSVTAYSLPQLHTIYPFSGFFHLTLKVKVGDSIWPNYMQYKEYCETRDLPWSRYLIIKAMEASSRYVLTRVICLKNHKLPGKFHTTQHKNYKIFT